jgi:hypothetical protein
VLRHCWRAADSEGEVLDVLVQPRRDCKAALTVRRGKTDQEGHGSVVAIVRGRIACPIAAFKAWIAAAGITAGPVFRPVTKGERIQAARLTDRSVAKIVKAHSERAGLIRHCSRATRCDRAS